MAGSPLGIVLLTYGRFEYAARTLETAVSHIETNEHSLRWHIASDGDGPEYVDGLAYALRGLGVAGVSVTNSSRGGYGMNYNLAMQVMHQACEWVLPLEDDWELTRTLNPDGLIADMVELGIGCARLGYIGYTQELRGKLVYGARCGHWLLFDPASAEPHVFSGHPRIERVSWARSVGPWPEGLNPGETEFRVAHLLAARQQVAWPLDVVRPSGGLFAHIGTVRSY